MRAALGRLVGVGARRGWTALGRVGGWSVDGRRGGRAEPAGPGGGRSGPVGTPVPVDLDAFRFERLVQCDGTTCGSACLVVARMVVDPRAAAAVLDGPGSVVDRFAAAQRAVKARTGALRTAGGWALPWPRALGTTPWGLARELRASAPGYRAVLIDPDAPAERARMLGLLRDAAGAGRPGALLVGSDTAPRHVVLVLAAEPEHLVCYEPSAGRLIRISHRELVIGPLQVAGWWRVWAAVTP